MQRMLNCGGGFAVPPPLARTPRLTDFWRRLYLTCWLINMLERDARRPPEHHVRCPRRSDPARHPGAARHGRAVGQRAGAAVFDEPARRLQAPQGAGVRRPDFPRTRCPVAALPPRSASFERRVRLGGTLPPFLGAELRPPGRVS